MARPIAPTPRLNKQETRRFLQMVKKDLKRPVGPIPTPKDEEVIRLIMSDADRSEK